MTESKNRLINRLLQYWLLNVEKTFVTYIGMFAIFIVYELVVAGGDSLSENLYMAPGMIMMGGIIALFVNSIMSLQMSVPIAISFGSTRKEAFWGNQFANGVMIVQIMIIYVILLEFMKSGNVFSSYSAGSVLMYFGILLIALGMGQIFALFITKLGTKGVAIFTVCSCMIIGFFAAIVVMKDPDLLIKVIKDQSFLGVVLLIIGVVLYAIGGVLNYINVKILQVK